MIYHYTTTSTLLNILKEVEKSDKFIFRGTHIEYLNDKTELEYSFDLFLEMIKKYEEANKIKEKKSKFLTKPLLKKLLMFASTPPFITSFSAERDSLPMWNTYSKNGTGIAIGIEEDDIKKYGKGTQSGSLIFGKCIYTRDEFMKKWEKHIPDIYNDIKIKDSTVGVDRIIFSELPSFLSDLKKNSYEYEREYRIIKSCSKYDKNKEINYYESNGLLKPYIEHVFPKKILKEIVIGPNSDMELSKKSIKGCLQRSGYNLTNHNPNYIVNIVESDIPFRII